MRMTRVGAHICSGAICRTCGDLVKSTVLISSYLILLGFATRTIPIGGRPLGR